MSARSLLMGLTILSAASLGTSLALPPTPRPRKPSTPATATPAAPAATAPAATPPVGGEGAPPPRA